MNVVNGWPLPLPGLGVRCGGCDRDRIRDFRHRRRDAANFGFLVAAVAASAESVDSASYSGFTIVHRLTLDR